MPNRIHAAKVCDATTADSSHAAAKIKMYKNVWNNIQYRAIVSIIVSSNI